MGSLYQRGNVWWIKYYDRGECKRESTGTTKKMVAKQCLARKEVDIARGIHNEIDFSTVVFDDLVDDLLVDYKINRKKSLQRVETSLKHLKKAFSGKRVVDITTQAIQNDYIQERLKWCCGSCGKYFHPGVDSTCIYCGSDDVKKGAANATINRELAALKRMLNLGVNQTPPKVYRVPYIPMLRENNTREGFFEHTQFLDMREALPEYLKPVITFGYKVGCRFREITSLTWANVDLKNGIVTLRAKDTKNQEARTVYLDQELQEMLTEQWEKRKRDATITPLVFPAPDGTGKINNLRRAWSKACREIGMGYGFRIDKKYVEKWKDKLPPGPIFHDLRRTAVRNMVRAGVPERVAMMVSGHKTRSVFDRYNIVNDTDLRMAAAKQEKYLESQVGTNPGTVTEFGPTPGQVGNG
jgi:integrase